MHMSLLPFSLLRFLVAVVILLIPTTCMGATLPLLARFVTSSLALVGNRIGTLYSVNTLGAVIGLTRYAEPQHHYETNQARVPARASAR